MRLLRLSGLLRRNISIHVAHILIANSFFIDSDGECVTMKIADAIVNRMFVTGSAEDYQLCIELIDHKGTYKI